MFYSQNDKQHAVPLFQLLNPVYDSEAILAHDATEETHQWGLIIKWPKCAVNFSASPDPPVATRVSCT